MCRCSRRNTNSLARRTRRTTACSGGERASAGCQGRGRMIVSFRFFRACVWHLLLAYARLSPLPSPLAIT